MPGSYNTISDAPEFLRIEAETITVRTAFGVPSAGQATVSWNIPTPARGCSAGDSGTYCGIVVVMSKTPIGIQNQPTDGKYYHDDPTADSDKHVGDKIGDALVVGTFWERENKGQEKDMTTSFTINDVESNQTYYIAGFAMDCALHYHTEGIRAYSPALGNETDESTPSFQNVGLGPNEAGVLPTDGTGLIPGKTYQFDLIYDPEYPTGKNFVTQTIKVDGIDAGTYQDLLDSINNGLAMMGNPSKLPQPPHYGSLYWDETNQKLYKFDGTTYQPVNDIFISSTDPAGIQNGSYWFDPSTGELRIWEESPGAWRILSYMNGITDPDQTSCDEYWFDGYTAYSWNGSAWVDVPTMVQSECPSAEYKPECGSYWFDSENETLFQWDAIRGQWVETHAIYWATEPNNPQNEDYWMDNSSEDDLRLSRWTTLQTPSQWVDITEIEEVYIQESKPLTPGVGAKWFQISTEELFLWNHQTGEWVEEDVMVWPDDPRDVESNDLWWNATNEYLYQWDVVTAAWVPVEEFIESDTNPLDDKEFALDMLWFDTDQNKMYRWDGETWVNVAVLIWDNPPTNPGTGAIYYNRTDNKWFIWAEASGSGGNWFEFEAFSSEIDPRSIPNGYYWMDTDSSVLSIRNGIEWLAVEYETMPYSHTIGDRWFNTTNDVVYMWDGEMWVESSPPVVAMFGDFKNKGCKYAGGIQFKSVEKGTGKIVFIPIDARSSAGGPGCITTGFGDSSATPVAGAGPFCTYQSSSGASCGYPARNIPDQDFLWSNLTPSGSVYQPHEGEDAPHDQPSYDVIGVGTDGTPDERRELIDSIRRQLGYPGITVELTHYQLRTAIQGALESYRKRTSASLKRGFYFLDIKPQQQRYMMTNRRVGYDRIVNIMDTYRFTSAFMTQAHAAGLYGQVVLQHLYNSGTFDLLSYDLVGQYINQLEISFASRLAYNWNEEKRTLDFYASFTRPERVLLDVMVERTEQDILKDRYAKSWIERYALSEAMIMLAQIRGKFSTLPGAGGGVALNADALQSLASVYREDLMTQIEDYIVEMPEQVGMGASMAWG